MMTLNREAAVTMAEYAVSGCTDITGFGFLGHLAEMVVDSGLGLRIDADAVPIHPEVREWAAMGMIPAGAYNNRRFRGSLVTFGNGVPQSMQDILFDPQTSGGLLIGVDAEEASALEKELRERGVTAAMVGEVVAGPEEMIVVT